MDAINRMSPQFRKTKEKELLLLDKINSELSSGKIDYIFDVNGKPLAYYNLALGKTVSLTPGITFDAFTPDFRESITFFQLTFDRGIQEKIHRLFKDYKGSFLLMNVNDSSIVAAYSRPAIPGKNNSNSVFTEMYEPGSIIKVMTMFTFLKSSHPTIFPFQCKGLWIINNEIFHDWTTHNQVKSFDDALAVSCNVAFAQMGVNVGFKSLNDAFKRFYFNSNLITDLFLDFQTGTFNDKISSNFQLANLAVGLNEVTITTFHAALISDIISQNGSIYLPYLIKSKKNLMNIGFYNHNPRLSKVFSDNTGFNKIKNSMLAVVESPDGTGRRAKVDFVRAAIKTGTSGKKEAGLDAVITGFFPFEKPQYAFAFRLEGAGKAELKGALFLKDFLTAFRHTGIK